MPIKIPVIIIFRNLYLYKFLSLLFSLTYTYTNSWVLYLACFADDYVATDMTKVRKFENGLKLSIRRKILGFLLQDMDSMVRMAMAIEIEIEDARSI